MDLRKIKKRLNAIVGQASGEEVKRLSGSTGISQRTIRRYLDAKDNIVPSLSFLVAVCRYYGVSLDQLILSGGRMTDSDIEHKWRVFVSWWSANLTEDDKALVMQVTETVWGVAMKRAAANPDLAKEAAQEIKHKRT